MYVRDIFLLLGFVWLGIQWSAIQTSLLRMENQIADLEIALRTGI